VTLTVYVPAVPKLAAAALYLHSSPRLHAVLVSNVTYEAPIIPSYLTTNEGHSTRAELSCHPTTIVCQLPLLDGCDTGVLEYAKLVQQILVR
jgi:hypothetical protein